MITNNPNILILGIGNYLMGDEGVGVHTALRLQEMALPALQIVRMVLRSQ
jgi:Ni,Fe-hydrogenase maturation factor